MRAFGLRLYRGAIQFAILPYIRRELPGWGLFYRYLVDIGHGRLWRDAPPTSVRGKMHGYDMGIRLDRWSSRLTYFLGRFHDLPTQLVIQRVLTSGDIFVDVGGSEGMMSLVASRAVGDNGTVIAFEPNPRPRAVFEENIRRNGISNVEIRPAGLGNIEAELELFVPDRSSGEGTFTKMDGVKGFTVRCPVLVGDVELGDHRPRLIKIDVEGFEARVLDGLSRTIERAHPMICLEMIAKHLARDGSSHAQIADFLQRLGYRGLRLGLRKSNGKHQLAWSPSEERWEDGDYLWVHREDRRAREFFANS